MRAEAIIYILAAIISCTLAQELPPQFPPEVLLRNAKNYYPTSGQNWNMYSGIPQAPVYKPVFGSSKSSSSYPSGYKYAANPELHSYQLELPPEFPPEVLLRNAKKYYPTAGPNRDIYSWVPQAPGYKPVFRSSKSFSPYESGYRNAANQELHSYQLELPPEFPPEILLRNLKNYYPTSGQNWDLYSGIPQAPVYKPVFGSSRYAANPELRSYQVVDINEVQIKLIKQAEQLNARLEETHQLMMKNFDKEKQILRAASETETTTEDKV